MIIDSLKQFERVGMEEGCICCFCGQGLNVDLAILIQIFPCIERQESQELLAHKKCFVEKMYKGIPLHPDLLD